MNVASLSDLTLIWPELILCIFSFVFLLVGHRIQNPPQISLLAVFSVLAAGLASGWALTSSSQTGFGGMIVVDSYSQFFKVLITVALALVIILSVRPVGTMRFRFAEYHALLLLASTGMMFAVSALDLLTLYLGLELMTLCSYSLVGITVEKRRSNEAAIKYFLVASFASAFLLYGIALVYGTTGSTAFTEIAGTLSKENLGSNPVLLVGIGLLVAGLTFKIAAVPFHAWAPDAYQGASVPVAAFLATAAKVSGLAVLGRISLMVFISEADVLALILAVIAALSIVFGSFVILAQTNMKRLLAYSSISHAGYALLGLISGTPEGISSTMAYAFLYVFMTLGAFGVVIALGSRGKTLKGFRGLAEQRPGIAALMMLFLLSLTGIPPTAGFSAKFGVILSIVREDYFFLAVLAVVCSVISAFVYLRIGVLMYMHKAHDVEPQSYSFAVSFALVLAALVTVIGGVFPGSLMSWTVAP